MALSFKQRDLVNLEFALQREFLGTNREGGYLSTTLNFCNTSRYHGLLVVPIDAFEGVTISCSPRWMRLSWSMTWSLILLSMNTLILSFLRGISI